MIIRNAGRKTRKVSKKAKVKAKAPKARKVAGKKIRPVIIKVGKKFSRPKRSRTFKHAVRINPKKRRRTRRNPSIKGILNRQNMITIGTLGIGLVAWPYLKGMINKAIPDTSARFEKYTGLIPVILGLVVLMMSRKPMLKNIGLGVGAFGVYDLLASNVAALKLVPPTANISGYYPASLGAAYRAPEKSFGTPAYGRPPAVSKHYMTVSGDNPYGDVQW